MDWKVKYYKKEDGTEPVSEFIASLPAKHAAKALWEIDLLEQFGSALRMPYTRAIEGKNLKACLNSEYSRAATDHIYSMYCPSATYSFYCMDS